MKTEKLANLQALRGVACLLVLGYHLAEWEHLVRPGFDWIAAFRWFGFAGVDLFFVLSGFVITWVHGRQFGDHSAVGRYATRRFVRVVPLYWVVLILTAVSQKVFLQIPFAHPGTEWKWAAWLTLIPAGPVNTYVPVAWTLTYELIFYTVFGLALLLPRPGGVILLVAMTAATVWPATGNTGGWTAHLLTPYILEFVSGCLAAWSLRRFGPVRAWTFLWAGCLLGVGLATAAHHADPVWLASHSAIRVVVFGLPAALIVYGAAAVEQAGGRTAPGWLRAVGDASYSLYLTHWPLATLVLYWCRNLPTGPVSHAVWIAVLLVSTLTTGFATHWLLERPTLNLCGGRSSIGWVKRRFAAPTHHAPRGGSARRSAA